ncbi:hypothetical protein RvY_04426-3 [Ramazzottius varieornatus]|uniref:Uncharacterized protein n=1 Tax=Ramazzottius varieornatus TaxID=947166 RepID=A0A1D1UXA7_RAMVA|nr:hypothetical protein RvY_04426-3 [Ramazzottius varieornatus]
MTDVYSVLPFGPDRYLAYTFLNRRIRGRAQQSALYDCTPAYFCTMSWFFVLIVIFVPISWKILHLSLVLKTFLLWYFFLWNNSIADPVLYD